MILNINDKEYEVYFGIAFVRALDEKYNSPGIGGSKFGLGLETLVSKVYLGDAVALSDILYAGTASEKSRPTQRQIDQYIDECEDIDALFEEVINALKKQNATRKRTLQSIEAIDNNSPEARKNQPKPTSE